MWSRKQKTKRKKKFKKKTVTHCVWICEHLWGHVVIGAHTASLWETQRTVRNTENVTHILRHIQIHIHIHTYTHINITHTCCVSFFPHTHTHTRFTCFLLCIHTETKVPNLHLHCISEKNVLSLNIPNSEKNNISLLSIALVLIELMTLSLFNQKKLAYVCFLVSLEKIWYNNIQDNTKK